MLGHMRPDLDDVLRDEQRRRDLRPVRDLRQRRGVHELDVRVRRLHRRVRARSNQPGGLRHLRDRYEDLQLERQLAGRDVHEYGVDADLQHLRVANLHGRRVERLLLPLGGRVLAHVDAALQYLRVADVRIGHVLLGRLLVPGGGRVLAGRTTDLRRGPEPDVLGGLRVARVCVYERLDAVLGQRPHGDV